MSTTTTSARTTRFYVDVLDLPVPDAPPSRAESHAIPVLAEDLPRLRGRLIAAGAPVEDLGPAALSFRDPSGRRVELVTTRDQARNLAR
jgi:hypothetical protein